MKTYEIRQEVLRIAQVKPESMKERLLALASKLNTRTSNQNRALHLHFTHIAEALNDAGYSVQEILAQAMDIDWNPENVKEILWKNAQDKVLKKKSTTQLRKTGDIELVDAHLARHLGEKFGITTPEFPHLGAESLDKQMAGYYEKQ